MKTRACAKINLGLNIVKRRPDGYHDLQTVFYPVPIFDDIEILADTTLTDVALVMEGQPVEGAVEDNLVVKAYRLLASLYELPPVKICLNKRIPMQAGMGGGSADATFTLRLLNDMFSLHMDAEQMTGLAAQLGADCPFFVEARPAYAEGIGERLSPIELDLGNYRMAIVKPPVAVSTREAFAHVQVGFPEINCRDVVALPMEEWRGLLKNDFEESIFPQHPIIGEAKEQLYKLGAVYAAMSGSGSALFGFFRKGEEPTLDTAFPNDWFKQLIV